MPPVKTAFKITEINSAAHRYLSSGLLASDSSNRRLADQAATETVRIFRSTTFQFVLYFRATSGYTVRRSTTPPS